MGITVGFATAQRCPDRPGLVDELGTLNRRPRPTLNLDTPAQRLAQLLHQAA
jgi:IS30 family transposase